MIDWTRMAEPQSDGYDSRILRMVGSSFFRPIQPCSQHVDFDGVELLGSMANGRVAVIAISERLIKRTGFCRTSHTQDVYDNVSTVLSDWPEVVLTFDSSVIFVVDVAIDGEWSSKNSGSSSTHLAEHLGAVFVTFYDPVGTACGCVHEMAHNKLMRLGVQMESSHKLILNDPCELFVSPVRKDKPRPMQAIMHAVYSFIHVTELLLRHVDSDSQRLNRMHSDRLRRLHDNLLPALDCLKQNVKTDMDGELFMKAFFSWADRVLEAALECSNKIPKL